MVCKYRLIIISLVTLLEPGLALWGNGQVARAAEKKIVVLPFIGPGNTLARQSTLKALARKADPISLGVYFSRAKALKVNGKKPSNIPVICSKLKCDAVIKGVVKRKRRQFTLWVTVFSGITGNVLGSRSGSIKGLKNLDKLGGNIGEKCIALLGKEKSSPSPITVAATPAPITPKPTVLPLPQSVPDRSTKNITNTTNTNIVTSQEKPPERFVWVPEKDTPVEESAEASKDDITLIRPSPRRAPKRLLLGLDLSVSLGLASRRTLMAKVDPIPQDPDDREYQGSTFPEINIHAALFPAAPYVQNFIRNIGLDVNYSHHLSISTRMQDEAGSPVESSSQELILDLLLRWPLFNTNTTPMIQFLAGWGLRDFDLGPNITLPSFNYRFFRLGADGAIPLATQLVALQLGGDVRILSAVGQAVADAFGRRDGGWGYSIHGGIQGKVPVGIFYFLNFEILMFRSHYDGLGDLIQNISSANLKNRPLEEKPTEAYDRYLRFWVGAGYTL